jgi:uncharacterized protein YeaO (DUF488 family)
MIIRIKHVHEPSSSDDGTRVLVERYRPRSVRSGHDVALWRQDLAPSPELVAWFGHKRDRWEEFKRRYWAELSSPEAAASVAWLRQKAESGRLTLVCGVLTREYSSARSLAELLDPTGASVELLRVRKVARGSSRRLPQLSIEGLADWLVILIGLLTPIFLLAAGALIVTYGQSGVITVGVFLAVLSVAVLIRTSLRERQMRLALDLPRHAPGSQSAWVGLKDAGMSVSGFAAGFCLLCMALLLASSLARLHLP